MKPYKFNFKEFYSDTKELYPYIFGLGFSIAGLSFFCGILLLILC